jgi:hypothetical protein
MEQPSYIKILQEEHHKAKKITAKLIQHFRTEALSYSEVCHWMREFAPGANTWKMHDDQNGP